MPTFIAIVARHRRHVGQPANAVGAEIFPCHRALFRPLSGSSCRVLARQTGKSEHEPGVSDFDFAGDRAVARHRARQLGARCRRVQLLFTKRIGGAWLHGLQMVIVPLVVALLVIGIAASAEAARAGKIAARALIAFVVILWVNTIVVGVPDTAAARAFPAPRRMGRCAARVAVGRQGGGANPEPGRLLRQDRADQHRRCRRDRLLPAADRVRDGVRLRHHAARSRPAARRWSICSRRSPMR